MHFVEFAVQHVRGFSPTGRFALKPGYVVLKPPLEPSPLAGLALALLYPDGRGGDASFVAPGQRAGKAAVIFVGQDGITYRVLRELGGGGTLHRINPATQQLELVTQDSGEANQFLQGQVGLPSRATLEQLFTLQAPQLPSRRPRRSAGSSSPGMPAPQTQSSPRLSGSHQVAPASDVSAAEAKIREMEKELVICREVDNLQFEVDGLNSEIFACESKLRGTEGLKEKLREAEEAWKAEPTLASMGLPDDILTRVERFPRFVAKRDEALARLRSDREAADEQARSMATVEPLVRNRDFWIALVAGVAFLGIGLMNSDSLRYVALLDIPAFGMAALLALRYVEDLQEEDRMKRRSEKFALREKKIEEEFEAEVGSVRQAMRLFDVDEMHEIPDRLQRREQLGAQVAQLRAQLIGMEKHPEYIDAANQLPVLRQQMELLNAKIAEKGTFVRDMREVEREIAWLRESIALARAPQTSTSPGVQAAARSALEDPSPAVLHGVAEVLAADVHASISLLRDRCLRYLDALTDKRYVGLEWDVDGNATLVAGSGQRIPAGELSPKDLDLYFLSLRMAAVEKLSARVKIPLIIEDVLVGVDGAKLPLMGRMLKHLGTLTQVLHVTAHPGFAQMSDTSVNL
jgi:hypothetical protein